MDRSRETRAEYAPDIWPSIGLKRAVIVVGGCDGAPWANNDGWVGEDDGSWNDGGVASGSVVKRIPVETPALFSLALK